MSHNKKNPRATGALVSHSGKLLLSSFSTTSMSPLLRRMATAALLAPFHHHALNDRLPPVRVGLAAVGACGAHG